MKSAIIYTQDFSGTIFGIKFFTGINSILVLIIFFHILLYLWCHLCVRKPITWWNYKAQILLMLVIKPMEFFSPKLQTLNTIIKLEKLIKPTLLFLLLSSIDCYFWSNYCSVFSTITYEASAIYRLSGHNNLLVMVC